MITKKALQRWIETLDEHALIAIDDGGLTLVEVRPDEDDPRQYEETGVYLQVGGVPMLDEPDEPDEPDETIHRYEALYSVARGYWYVDLRGPDGGETIKIGLSKDNAEALAASLNELRFVRSANL